MKDGDLGQGNGSGGGDRSAGSRYHKGVKVTVLCEWLDTSQYGK